MKIWGGLIVLVATVLFAGVAGAQTQEGSTPDAEALVLEAQSSKQNAAIARGLEGISTVGSSLGEAQSQANVAQARSQQLAGQARELQGQLALQRQTFEESKSRYEKQAEAAYKGENLKGATAVLGSIVGGEGDIGTLADKRIARVLSQGRQDLNEYQVSRQRLENTGRQISQKEIAYKSSVKEKRRRAKRTARPGTET